MGEQKKPADQEWAGLFNDLCKLRLKEILL